MSESINWHALLLGIAMDIVAIAIIIGIASYFINKSDKAQNEDEGDK
jgi:hypothetical protein